MARITLTMETTRNSKIIIKSHGDDRPAWSYDYSESNEIIGLIYEMLGIHPAIPDKWCVTIGDPTEERIEQQTKEALDED